MVYTNQLVQFTVRKSVRSIEKMTTLYRYLTAISTDEILEKILESAKLLGVKDCLVRKRFHKLSNSKFNSFESRSHSSRVTGATL